MSAPVPRLAFPAMVAANLLLALGPWMVRLADVGPVASGFWRMAIAIPFLAALVYLGRNRPGGDFPRGLLALFIVLGGLFFAADLAAWHKGILLTRLANASLFGNFSSFLFAAYGFLLIRALPGKVQAAALVLAVAGTALLLGASAEFSAAQLEGDLLCILAGLFYTFYLVAIDRARKTAAPSPVLALATIAGALPLLGFALLMGEQVVPGDWTPLILLSFGSQLFGQGLLVYAMGHVSPVVTAVAMLIQPAAGAVIGWVVYGEAMGALDILGALAIAAALVLIRLPERAKS